MTDRCDAVLALGGERYQCDDVLGHEQPWMGRHGTAHGNSTAHAIWAGSEQAESLIRADERERIALALSFPAVHDKLSTYSYRKGFDDGRADAARIARGES